MLTPQEAESHVFPKASFGGYNMLQVDAFLDSLIEDYRTLYQENASLKSKMKVLVEKVEEYRATEDAMRMTLHSAQKMADAMVKEGEAKKQAAIDQIAASVEEKSKAVRAEMAKEEQAVVEARIADLEATLKVARIMDDSDLSLDTVSIGMHVRILAEGDEPDEAEEYDITGSTEADIDQGRISDESPVGAALIGHKTGDKVDVTLPNGNILEYTILGVSRSR